MLTLCSLSLALSLPVSLFQGPPAELMDHRVLQRRGKILKEEQGGFENLVRAPLGPTPTPTPHALSLLTRVWVHVDFCLQHETYSATELAGASKRRPFASDGGEFGLGVAPEAMKPASNGISTRKQLLATRRASMVRDTLRPVVVHAGTCSTCSLTPAVPAKELARCGKRTRSGLT